MPIAKMRSQTSKDPLFPIILSVIFGSILVVYPLSYATSGWRPLFMFLIMMFWVLCQPSWCGVWFAFAIGLFSDLLLDAPLGMNALSFVLVTFVTRFLIRDRRILTFGNLSVIVMLAMLAHLLLIWLLQTMMGLNVSIARHWQPFFSSMLVWPVVYYGLHKWRI